MPDSLEQNFEVRPFLLAHLLLNLAYRYLYALRILFFFQQFFFFSKAIGSNIWKFYMLQIPHRPTLFSFVQFHSNVSLNISAYMSKQSVVNKKRLVFVTGKMSQCIGWYFALKWLTLRSSLTFPAASKSRPNGFLEPPPSSFSWPTPCHR